MGQTIDEDRGDVRTTIGSNKTWQPRHEQKYNQDDYKVLGSRTQQGDLLQQEDGQRHELAFDHLHVGSKSPGNYGI
jgi:hypothetical protein